MLNVVFLDVDGELTYSDYSNNETANIDISKVKILKQIVDENDAKVVISSSWRGSEKYTPKIYFTLINILNENNIEVLGNTPFIKDEFDGDVSQNIKETTLEDLPYFKLKYGTGRAAEIKKYIEENQVDTFLILDDEDWNWADYSYEDKWIQPTWFGDGGLKEYHIKEAKKIFDKQKGLL